MSTNSPDPEPCRAPQPGTTSQRTGDLPLFQVVLHGAAIDDMLAALRNMLELTRCGVAEASRQLIESQHVGRAPLVVTHRERAEHLAQQFTQRGLTVTVEPFVP